MAVFTLSPREDPGLHPHDSSKEKDRTRCYFLMPVDEWPVIGPTVLFKTLPFRGRRGGSAVKSIVALVRTRVWFSVPTWQLTASVPPVPRDPLSSPGLCGHQACTWYIYMHASKTLIT